MSPEAPLFGGMLLALVLIALSVAVGGGGGTEVRADRLAATEKAQTQEGWAFEEGGREPAEGPAAEPAKAPTQAGAAGAGERPKKRRKARAGGASSPAASAAGAARDPAGDSSGSSAPRRAAKQRRSRRPAAVSRGPLTVTGNAGSVRSGTTAFAFRGSGHTPRVNRPWTITASARRGGSGSAGTVSIDVMHQGKVVGHVHDGPLRGGSYRRTIKWPKESAGHPLVLRTTVTAGGVRQAFLYTIRVR